MSAISNNSYVVLSNCYDHPVWKNRILPFPAPKYRSPKYDFIRISLCTLSDWKVPRIANIQISVKRILFRLQAMYKTFDIILGHRWSCQHRCVLASQALVQRLKRRTVHEIVFEVIISIQNFKPRHSGVAKLPPNTLQLLWLTDAFQTVFWCRRDINTISEVSDERR